MAGPLALVGGGEWREGCSFDAELLSAAGASEVTVLPTAAAFENPGRYQQRAESWFGSLGVTLRWLPVLQRADANEQANADAVRRAKVLYLVGDSSMHLRSVLKDTPVWEALVAAWEEGATVVASGAAGSALLDPMFDVRGGAFTVGLGLVKNLALLPDAEDDVAEHHGRTLELADPTLVLAAVQRCTALIREGGSWRTAGTGTVRVFLGDRESGLDALPA